jgi:hypothetical protein
VLLENKVPLLNAAETASGVKALLNAGVSQEAIDKALGKTPDATGKVDDRSPELRAYDRVMGAPATPAEYRDLYGGHAAEVAAASPGMRDGELRQALHAMGASQSLAPSVVSAWLDSASVFAKATDSGASPEKVAQFGRQEHYKLGELSGAFGSAADAVTWAAEALRAMPKATRDSLQAKHAFDTAEAVIRLATLGRNSYWRSQLAGRKA